jgi:hypothetical protein
MGKRLMHTKCMAGTSLEKNPFSRRKNILGEKLSFTTNPTMKFHWIQFVAPS